MSDVTRLWRVLKRRVWMRRVPHTLISWRFLLPCSGPIALHRKVFLNAWPELPRLLYACIVLYSLVTWFGYHGWAQLTRAYRRKAIEVATVDHIPKHKQCWQLVVAVGRGIPPHSYYAMQLFRLPSADWWCLVFDHQLPHWHSVLQRPQLSEHTRRMLADKAFFAECLLAKGLSAVPTQARVVKGQEPPWDTLLQRRDLFFKPVTASRAEGCFALRYDVDAEHYQLQDADGVIAGEGMVKDAIRQYLEQRDYLVQPLLHNEVDLEAALATVNGLNSERIMTLRIITGRTAEDGIHVRLANLERSSADYKRWQMYSINLGSGEADVDGRPVVLPGWDSICRLVCDAHALCADQLTVGWDVVMTNEGPLVLEGNVNWGVQAHQIPPRMPLLAGPMRAVYGLGE